MAYDFLILLTLQRYAFFAKLPNIFTIIFNIYRKKTLNIYKERY